MTVVKIKKQKAQNSVLKKKINLEDYKNCFEEKRFRKIYLKKEFDADNLKRDHRELKFVLKTHQILKSEWYNVFTEEVNKIALSLNDDRIMQTIDSIKTYAYGTSKI